MTTQSYYKDRLGFDPNDPREMSSLDPTLHGYEENLSKFKGITLHKTGRRASRFFFSSGSFRQCL
ncbi:Microtubule-actin cross-linking factor 1 [Daphnia magna]|uniref:Microtubule-actin cross-linking factor 1 n=1 Tax=Daphnia magna TaxID=35525 RepID=A0A162P6Y8_9CRUS|nr:Microtubule-actin cross-linking factor 1 [Daphnia magna]